MMAMFFTITTQVTFLSSYALATEGGGGIHSSISASGYGPEGPNLGGPNPLGHRNI